MILKLITPLTVFIVVLIINRKLLGRYWLISQLFLIISPWFIQLLYSPIELNWLFQPTLNIPKVLHNLSVYSSGDYLFFTGSHRLEYGTQEAGLVYLSFLPLWLIGLLQSISQPRHRWLPLWLGGGVLLSSFFASAPIFSATLLYIPAIQILTGLGAVQLISNFRRYHSIARLGLILLALLIAYEAINFFHTLMIHYPQRLQIEGLNLSIL